MISKKEILKFMTDTAHRPLSFKDFVKALKVPKEERDPLKALIKKMAADGDVVKIRDNRYGIPKKMNLLKGRLQCHPNGFGFVIPDEGGEDLFIGRTKMKGAMHGDKVVSRIEGVKKGGKREGSIIRVLERGHKSIIGRIETTRSGSFVIPSDERILENIFIEPRDTMNAPEGMLVVAEITRYPAQRLMPAGKITEVLGDPNDPDVEIEVITRKYGLPLRFPTAIDEEAKKVPKDVREADIAGRIDLRAKHLVTIDGETAKDFDDAVAIEIKNNGGYRLYVSIADVSHYVKEGELLDEEAYNRSTSVYFPDRCVPMLPESLSNGICSLNPKVDRLTLTAELDFDPDGRITNRKFYTSVIKSSARLTYKKVKHILEGDVELSREYAFIVEDLKAMKELAEKLMANRAEDGSIDFDLPEPQIIIDLSGQVEDIVKSERNIAHRIIEEFMLSANRAVASEFAGRKWPFIYRIHEEPAADSITDFKEFAAGFGYAVKGHGPKSFRDTLEYFEGKTEEKLINHVLLRSMKQAVYSSENIGHFGLAFEKYTHFTSPIRRYPDLIVHRLLKKLLTDTYTPEERSHAETTLPDLCAHTSGRERNAMGAEREIVDLKKAQFMIDKVGEEYDGIISGVTSFGLFVELKEYFVEGLVHITTIQDDYYTLIEKEHSLVGESGGRRFSLGSEVRVKIENVDIARRQIDLLLAEEGAATKKKAAPKRGNFAKFKKPGNKLKNKSGSRPKKKPKKKQ